jgi:hypothetical protein
LSLTIVSNCLKGEHVRGARAPVEGALALRDLKLGLRAFSFPD